MAYTKVDGPWREEAARLYKLGQRWPVIANAIREKWPELLDGMDKETAKQTVRGWVRSDHPEYFTQEQPKADPEKDPEPEKEPEKPKYQEEQKINEDGSRNSKKLLELQRGRLYSKEEMLIFHGFDPEEWDAGPCTNKIWNGMTSWHRGNELVELYESILIAKPKGAGLTLADIDRYMENKRFSCDIPLPPPKQYDPSGETLEIGLPDFHGGLLAWIQETGADYDIHIAKQKFFQCLYDIIDRCAGRKFKRIIFATLGDLLHTDNDQQTTTKGTPQQTDGRMAKISDAIMDMLIDGIELLSRIAPVHVVYLSGNHDRVTGRMLMQCVHMSFKYRPNNTVTFDMSPNPQKYIEIGCNLIGLTHGCMAGKNMDKWLQVDAREAWGRCKHAEVHQGHNHTQAVKEGKYITYTQTEDVGGVVIRTLPVICNASYWEHTEGYTGATKAMMCFVWHEVHGLREMWYSCV